MIIIYFVIKNKFFNEVIIIDYEIIIDDEFDITIII
jgi:hypothetical protein